MGVGFLAQDAALFEHFAEAAGTAGFRVEFEADPQTAAAHFLDVLRTEVLQALGFRSGVDDLKQLASILIQADKFGSSVATALRVQSDSMRTKRRQIAEEKAAKTAVKMIFPLVLFIFPGIFVVLVGPAGISMYRNMLSK